MFAGPDFKSYQIFLKPTIIAKILEVYSKFDFFPWKVNEKLFKIKCATFLILLLPNFINIRSEITSNFN